MTDNDEFNFDDKSGISVEEQKDIVTKINAISEKNRLVLSGVSINGKKNKINAKKKGFIFPVIVNVTALVILIGGSLLLISFNAKMDNGIREGTGVYTVTERALINEIRRDTAEKLALKDKEISFISSRLADVDAQLSLAFSNNEDLAIEQEFVQGKLIADRQAYRSAISYLQNERSQILEDSRSKEAKFRSLLDERAKESAAANERFEWGLTAATIELERLSSEQEKIAAIDAQMAGGLSSVSSMVNEGQYDLAAKLLENLRLFCNSKSISSARSFQTKKEFYNQAISSMGAIVADMIQYRNINSEGFDLHKKNEQLENEKADLEKRLENLSQGSSGQSRRLNEIESNLSASHSEVTSLRSETASLKTEKAALESNIADKNKTISTLESDKLQLTQTAADLRSSVTSLEQENQNLKNQLATIRRLLKE